MTKQVINIGTAEDDGTGDHNRVAWDKTNQNFTELYNADATFLPTASAAATYQPLDADLTAIAALAGTNVIYYRSAANTWAAVNVSTGLSFSGGNLTATGGGGDVFKAGANTFTAQNCFTNVGVVIGYTAPIFGNGLEAHGSGSISGVISSSRWVNDASGPALTFFKSRGATVSSYVAVQSNDVLGDFFFDGICSNNTTYANAARIRALVNGAPGTNFIPGAITVQTTNAAGVGVLTASLSPAACNFIGSTSAAVTGYVGEYLEFTSSPGSALSAGAYTTCMMQSIPAGDWDIQGIVRVSGTAGAYMYVTIHTAAGSSSTPLNTQTGILTGMADCWTYTPPVRVLLTTATNYQINVYMQSAGTLVQVIMTARRRH